MYSFGRASGTSKDRFIYNDTNEVDSLALDGSFICRALRLWQNDKSITKYINLYLHLGLSVPVIEYRGTCSLVNSGEVKLKFIFFK